VLRPFGAADLAPFAALNAHPSVVEWVGFSLSRAESDALVERISAELEREGWGSWAVETIEAGDFIGMVGLNRVKATYPFAPAVEIGWRLHPSYWGFGYASEAAAAALHHGSEAGGLEEIVAFTSAANVRSRSVMQRIGMVRDLAADFEHPSLPEGSRLRPHVLYRARPDETAGT
jgi:RimJ/RimL family protein N-acetyltransferase